VAYPRAIKPNHALDTINALLVDLGTPLLADTDWIVVDRAMANATFVLAHADSGDSPALARNVTVKGTQAGGSDDTFGTVTVTGTNVNGDVISEAIVPVNGSTVAGVKAFATVTSVVQSGWTAGGTADRIEVGFGALIGLPNIGQPALSAARRVVTTFLDGAIVVPTVVWDADEIEKNTINSSSGTFNGAKSLFALIAR